MPVVQVVSVERSTEVPPAHAPAWRVEERIDSNVPKPLVIVESPAKARTIASFLGNEYHVESSVGHIRDLPSKAQEIPKAFKDEPWARLGVNVNDSFKPLYIVVPRQKDNVKKLRGLLKDASELYLATDEDREGEAIAWHLLEALAPQIPVKRMVFHEITREAIERAIGDTRELDRKLVDAQEARRILDRLYGWEVSEVLWKKISPRLSAGRVQSVATRLVVERERARMAFRSGSWWDVVGTFSVEGPTSDNAVFGADLVQLDGRRLAQGRDFDPATGQLTAEAAGAVVMLDEPAARGLAARLDGRPFRVASVESKDYTQRPSPPFITSTLQQEAGRKLRFSSARAMAVAQRLYERGFITYMRTDSTNLSEQAVTAARSQIAQLYGPDYVPAVPRTYQKKVKNAQEAHEAIRPAGDNFRLPDQVRRELDDDEFRMYDLIWKRTVACQMADARGQRVQVRLGATTGQEEVVFQASGKTIEFPGYLRAYVEGTDDPDAELEDQEVVLPTMVPNQDVEARELRPDGHTTQPPARYTEASLVKELEARGIGRPSTYASVIQTIQDRGYVWKKGTALVPSWTAFAVVQLLEQHFSTLVDYDFTARMEEDLDAIARGEAESTPWLSEFYFGHEGGPTAGGRVPSANGNDHGDGVGLHALVEERLPDIDARSLNSIPLGEDPSSGQPVVLRVGRYGPYVQRADQTGAVPDDLAPDELTVDVALGLIERQNAPDQVLGNDPETGQPIIAKDGRYGPYVQLGEPVEGEKKKPRTASLFRGMTLDTITVDDALKLLSLPRTVGTDDDGTPIVAANGRFGPYLKKGDDTRSLGSEEELFTVTVEQAKDLFAQPKRRGRAQPTPIATLGEHPDTKLPINMFEGRYGPYVTDGTTNASLPKGKDPSTVTLDEAVGLILARAAAGPSEKKRPARRSPSGGGGGAKGGARRGAAKKK
jgi:DNA topoisomerase I